MIKITKQDGTRKTILEVTNGAYENIYKKMGYVPLETQPEQSKSEPPPKGDNDLFLDAVAMKPIAQWSKKELQRYAVIKGLDPKAEDLRDAIKQQIDNDHT